MSDYESAFKSEEYPFSSNWIKIQNHKMHYLDHGTGFPVVMLHGNPTWSFFYRNLVKKLCSNFRCIVPDHMGCGLSDKPQIYDYCLTTHIDNCISLIEKLKLKKFNLVVHDWGGAIGMGVAARMPEKINRLIIMNTSAFADSFIPLRIAVGKIPIIGEFAIRQLNLFVQAARYMATVKENGLQGEILRCFLYPYNNFKNRIAVYNFVKDIPMHKFHRSYNELKFIEKNLSLFKNRSITLIWGCKDFCFTPHFMARFKEFFPKAKCYPFYDANHYILEDKTADVTEIIENAFLKNENN